MLKLKVSHHMRILCYFVDLDVGFNKFAYCQCTSLTPVNKVEKLLNGTLNYCFLDE